MRTIKRLRAPLVAMFGVTVAAVALAMPASADVNYPPQPPTDVLGTSANVEAAGASEASGELAFTGGTFVGLGALGGVLLVGGTAMVVASKRRKVNG